VFPNQTSWQYSDGDPPPPNGGVECRWGRQKSRFPTSIWLHHVLSTLRPPGVINDFQLFVLASVYRPLIKMMTMMMMAMISFTDRHYWRRRSWRHLATVARQRLGPLASRFGDVVVADIACSTARRSRLDDRPTRNNARDLVRHETGNRKTAVCRPTRTAAIRVARLLYVGSDCHNLSKVNTIITNKKVKDNKPSYR